MSEESRKIQLSAKMLVCTHTVKNLLDRIHAIEEDTEASTESKLLQIKKIRDEITKVGMEIDTIKTEITLLKLYSVN
jgi:hypothetical protein